MSQVYILHESPEWYGPLDKALEEAGVPHGELFLDTGVVDVTGAPPEGVFFNRLSGTAHTRNHVLAVEHARAVLRWLEGHGRRVVNGSEALEIAMSKAALTAALTAFGIRTPRTVAAVGLNRLEAAAAGFEGPFLVKPNRSGKGVGIQKFDAVGELVQAVDSGDFGGSIDGVYIVQDYIASPEPFITRCEFIGGEFTYALASRPSGGFNLCPTDVCQVPGVVADDTPRFRIREGFAHPILDVYKRFLRHHRIEVAAVEFITDGEGRPYTYDLNINTNYNAEAEQIAGKSNMRAMARFLGRELAALAQPLRVASGG
jgi:hypothetical protein